jgi:anti-sigma regulatory factor (Ser/Thr protein kinase)
MSIQSYPLGELKVPYNKAFAQTTTAYTKHLCTILQQDEKAAYQLQIAVEEAFVNAVEHCSFSPETDDFITVSFSLSEGNLTVSIREKGIPFQLEFTKNPEIISLEDIDAPGLGMTLIKSFVDKVELLTHGRAGKEVRLTKHLPNSISPETLFKADSDKRKKRIFVKNTIIREPEFDELAKISALAWKCYGYTQEAFLYELGEIQEAFNNGSYIPMIAENPENGEIFAHSCFKIHDPNVPVGELSLAFIDPGYKAPGTMVSLAHTLIAKGREIGLSGFFDCSVTTHIYSQKPLQEEVKTTPCGMFIAIAAEGMRVKELKTTIQRKGTVVNHYFPFKKDPMTVYPPKEHEGIIREIYDRMQLVRTFEHVEEPKIEEESVINVFDAPEELNISFVTVLSYGKDYTEKLSEIVNSAKLKKKDALFLFAPLAEETSPTIYSESKNTGFSFAGIMPHIHNGKDRILMQWINTSVDINAVRIYGDFGKKLFARVVDELKKQNSSVVQE